MDNAFHLLEALERLGRSYPGIIGIVSAVAALLALFAQPVRTRIAGYLRPRSPDPVLSDPPRGDGGLARYTTRAVALLGRADAVSRLVGFLESDRQFAWMQIAGAGGQGKSRLAYELTILARDDGWQAGLVETADLANFRGHWFGWQPRQRHLFVLDYVIGREADIKIALQALAARSGELRAPVRLLLIERQRWDTGGLAAIGVTNDEGANLIAEGRAEWFLALAERFDGNDPLLESTRFEDGVLELERLTESDLINITRQVAELEGHQLSVTDKFIGERLRKIDSAGRPLYAYFLGQAFAAGSTVSLAWSRYDLLDATLDRDQGSRWRAALGDDMPKLGDRSLAERLAVIATIAGGLDCTAAHRGGITPHADSQTRRRAQILTDAGLGSRGSSPSRYILGLQPDLLGEWLVLRAVRQGLLLDDALGPAWQVNADQTAAFLSRLAQDFPADELTAAFLNFKPVGAVAASAFERVAAGIARTLLNANARVPTGVADALTTASERGDALAMSALGNLCWYGRGINQDQGQAVVWWRKGAEAGNGSAMRSMGWYYAYGPSVERDDQKAVAWYRKGAEVGDGGAMAGVGRCYEHGKGVEPDMRQAVFWYRKGAEMGSVQAMVHLGLCYEFGKGVEPDVQQALAWYRRGTELGSGDAMANLGRFYEQGKGVEPDIQRALSWYREGTELGASSAITNLGLCYELGKGVEPDMQQAVAWYRKAAEAGSGVAMVNLGLCYEQGKGVEPDIELAIGWYRKGDEVGNGSAMARLGWSYAEGRGVERDVQQAVAWYRKGAELGDAAAMCGLGWCYANEQGAGQDMQQALVWYRKAAEMGSGEAMCKLGVFYQMGQGVERDVQQCLVWLRKGAAAGDGAAMTLLGMYSEQGGEVERDLEEAFSWYLRGKQEGIEQARLGAERLSWALALLGKRGAQDTSGTKAAEWAVQWSGHLGDKPWADAPPVVGDWHDSTNAETHGILVRVRSALEQSLPHAEIETFEFERLRKTALPFYRGCALVDLQLRRTGQKQAELLSALISASGAALLDGTSPLLHALNPDLLHIDNAATAASYLRFFCTFVRAKDGPFQVVESIRDLPLDASAGNVAALDDQLQSISPISIEEESTEHYAFLAWVLHSNAVFRCSFKLYRSGLVEMPSDDPFVGDLPVLRRSYQGAFRSPLGRDGQAPA